MAGRRMTRFDIGSATRKRHARNLVNQRTVDPMNLPIQGKPAHCASENTKDEDISDAHRNDGPGLNSGSWRLRAG